MKTGFIKSTILASAMLVSLIGSASAGDIKGSIVQNATVKDTVNLAVINSTAKIEAAVIGDGVNINGNVTQNVTVKDTVNLAVMNSTAIIRAGMIGSVKN